MPELNPKYLTWQVPEYRVPKRGRSWYIVTGIFLALCFFFSLFTISSWRLVFLGYNSNFLFILILLIASAIMYFNEKSEPLMITFQMGPEGIKVGGRFYDYDEIKNFAVLYKPKQSVKQLYFEFKNSARPRLSIPLRRMEALAVRNFLIRYLDEDLERDNPPLSEQLTKLLKL